MTDFEHPYEVQVLPHGSREASAFHTVTVNLDPMRHTGSTIKDKLGYRGLLVHAAGIVDEEALLRNWYDAAFPVILVCSTPDFEEAEEWSKNGNQVARLLNAQATIDLSFVSLGRCYWQSGFSAFFAAATVLRQLVEASGTYDYQRRSEVVTMAQKQLTPVIAFNEHDHAPMLPPILMGDVTGGPYHREWVDRPPASLSTEERVQIQRQAAEVAACMPTLTEVSDAVVRVFGYHDAASSQTHVASFTAFFVSPELLLTARTSCFCEETNTFAHSFAFTTNKRCLHGMLRPGVDLHTVKPIEGLTDILAARIRHIGIALEDSKVPPGFYATPWNDYVLLEVQDAKQFSPTYLLPELTPCDPAEKERIFAVTYANRPTDEWLGDNFGGAGHNNDAITEDDLRRQWWSYDLQCSSVGHVVGEEAGAIKHNCSLLPGSRGAPMLRSSVLSDAPIVPTGDEDGSTTKILTYSAINSGRAAELRKRECDAIESMSTSELARRDSLKSNMFNVALPAHHLCLVILYQEVISKRITRLPHRQHMRKFLSPYDIFVEDDILSACHRKMLKDAEDHNEYGMDFYDHHDLDNALSCFREGAKMFSTASIPNLSEHENELKAALQTNVSAVVVAKMNL
jgi:hypothetical protein